MFKKLALAAVLVAGSINAFAATDQTYTEATPVTPTSPSLHSFSHMLESGSFFDTYNFTVGTPGELSASAISLELGKVFGIANLTGTLWNNFHPYGTGGPIGTFTGTNVTASFGSLAAGQYHIDFTGELTGALGGGYVAGVSVAAVPEPESYAMFLAGLGLMGAVARRRKQA